MFFLDNGSDTTYPHEDARNDSGMMLLSARNEPMSQAFTHYYYYPDSISAPGLFALRLP